MEIVLGQDHRNAPGLGKLRQPGGALLPAGELYIHKAKAPGLEQVHQSTLILLGRKPGLSALPLGAQRAQQGLVPQVFQNLRQHGQGVAKKAIQAPLEQVRGQVRHLLQLAEQRGHAVACKGHA